MKQCTLQKRLETNFKIQDTSQMINEIVSCPKEKIDCVTNHSREAYFEILQ